MIEASTSYDAYGNPTTKEGLSSYTPFGFAGSYTDTTGLIYLINHYYDPATGQFISVDPLVAQTGQPYAYTGGDPVNLTDPSGMCWSLPAGAMGPCNPAPPGINYNSSCFSGIGPPDHGTVQCGAYNASTCRPVGITGGAAGASHGFGGAASDVGHGLDFAGGAFSGWSRYNDLLGENSLHFSDSSLLNIADASILADNLSRVAVPLGAAATIGVDVANGHGVPYAAGDAGSSTGGAWAGAVAGSLACGGPEDGVGVVCGAFAALVGGGTAHWIFAKIF